MLTFSIQSGSNGNCIFVQAGRTQLLFDAGVSGRTAVNRMQHHGFAPRDADALFLTHEHQDHIRCAGVFHRKFHVPIYSTAATWRAARGRMGSVTDVRHFAAGDSIAINDVRVHSIPTPHDAVDSVVFIVEHERHRLGIFTDLGHPFDRLRSLLQDVDAAYLESNYDANMLATGPYPAELKRRIAGHGGHLSNDESAAVLNAAGASKLRWIALAHLSEQNNTPDMALETHRRTIGQAFPFVVAPRHCVSRPLTV